jgi:hypothetical protein
MPRFTLRITGMALFVRHKYDNPVDVRFVTEHHHGRPEERHAPVLFLSPDSWSDTSDDGARKGRAPARPIYLAQFDWVRILLGGSPLHGAVAVSKTGEWTNFDKLIPRLTSEVFATGEFSKDNAQKIAPHGVITLNGGSLSAEPPIHPEAESPWEVLDPDGRPRGERNLSDVATYSFEFGFEDSVQLQLKPRFGNPFFIHFKPRFDIHGWVAHQPFLASLVAPQVEAADSEIRHLAQAAGFLDPDNLKPRIFRLKPHGSAATPQRFNPDDPLCPPLQVEVD